MNRRVFLESFGKVALLSVLDPIMPFHLDDPEDLTDIEKFMNDPDRANVAGVRIGPGLNSTLMRFSTVFWIFPEKCA